ncbi:hypothetical protein F7725_022658 [Dissostichus mawsoni]|uniref:Uncharacterized protein n=1 Tax=Dissostichus mawsoni TaxID=36200 RepID=A0A7J5YZI0_DISMA|nr:hypothetical protein F7725_022658 [Dissostichus mawsoni]
MFACNVFVTIGLPWRTAAAESHDDGSESEASLHTVLPDALQDVEREVDVQITKEHNAVTILQEEEKNTQTNCLSGSLSPTAGLSVRGQTEQGEGKLKPSCSLTSLSLPPFCTHPPLRSLSFSMYCASTSTTSLSASCRLPDTLQRRSFQSERSSSKSMGLTEKVLCQLMLSSAQPGRGSTSSLTSLVVFPVWYRNTPGNTSLGWRNALSSLLSSLLSRRCSLSLSFSRSLAGRGRVMLLPWAELLRICLARLARAEREDFWEKRSEDLLSLGRDSAPFSPPPPVPPPPPFLPGLSSAGPVRIQDKERGGTTLSVSG